MFYEMTIAGHKRQLPLFKVTDDLYIGAFIMFSDVEITVASAGELLKKAPEFDILVTAEAKSIPLIHEMARQAGVNDYVVARKGPKIYMDNIITTEVDSITTDHIQTLCIGQKEIDLIKGRRVLIVDDVISTGESARWQFSQKARRLTETILFSSKNFLYLMRTERLRNKKCFYISLLYASRSVQ